ncbi:MAG: alpha-N-arabinofuranosidase [Oscillospiraceae bacterium]|jgi:alpha-N-arabinofuranosidase|nr:alpha-N-arabinofuranosidase [Oscillospiraceae bacterium]
MKNAKMTLDRAYEIGAIDRRLYGSFIEHLGRAVYGGIYEPSHPTADANGFRKDVVDLVRNLDVPVTRYPGGNFVSGFNWEDSVGPRESRPKRLDLAWFTTESNEVGLHEFIEWCKLANTAPMYAVNLGTRGADEARAVVEYANHQSGSLYSDMRVKNGAKEPFGIKLWCLGNEMDGPWQIGHKTAREYGRAANEAAKVMKWVDPSIELVACGSSSLDMPTFGDWELTMLDECYDNVDYVSLHRYYNNRAGDTRAFLARSVDMDVFIKTVASICDSVRGKKHSKKTLGLSFDEWNVWFHSGDQDKEIWKRDKWGRALPLLEDAYTFEDALLVGSLLITLLRNADRVKVACLAQLVNVIAPIMTVNGGGAWAQTIYWPFKQASQFGRGISLRAIVDSPLYDCKDIESVPELDATATLADDGGLTIFAVNKNLSEDTLLSVSLHGFPQYRAVTRSILTHDDMNAVNTETNPSEVVPIAGDAGKLDGDKLEIVIPKHSWNVIRLV